MKKLILLGLLFSAPLFAFSEQEACEHNGIDYTQAQIFVSKLKTSLVKNDKKAVANLMDYPLRVNHFSNQLRRSVTYTIKDKRNFLLQYDHLFQPQKIKNIVGSKEIFCNYQGAMLANGFIWFNTENKEAKIFVINK